MKRRFAMLVIALGIVSGVSLFAQETDVFSSPEPSSSPSSTTVESTPSVPTEASPTAPPESAAVPSTPPPLPPLPQPTPQKRGWMSHVLHPFGGGSKPHHVDYSNPKLQGLVLNVDLTPQTVKLSEVRQLNVHVTLTNKSKTGVTLEFPNDQRIDIHLLNPAELVLTRWSDNHAIKDKPGTLLINPQEAVEYKETIATRDLSPDKVYTVEVFFPKYPELRVRQKFLTAP